MKKAYEKPEVNKVKLAAEEAVLNNCKAKPVPGTIDICELPDGLERPLGIGS